jgi:acetyl esterase/lipase
MSQGQRVAGRRLRHPVEARTIMREHILEPAAQEFADATSKPPFLYRLRPEGARKVLDDIQAAPIEKPDVDEKWLTVPAEVGDVRARIVKPVGAANSLPVILYVHGGGWVLGNAGTHDRLIRELAVGVSQPRDGVGRQGDLPGARGPDRPYDDIDRRRLR